MLTGLAHTAICVPDVEAAVDWYVSVLGLELLSPPLRMAGEALERDLGELVSPAVIQAAILGFPGDGDRVLEVVEYPEASGRPRPQDASIADHGFTHVGLLCDDLARTRAELEARGARFLTRGIAEVAGLRTSWLRDPFGMIFILMEKGRGERPYYRQHGQHAG